MEFREVIRPPLWLLSFIYFMFLSLVVAVWAALGNFSALVTLVILSIALIVIAVKSKDQVCIRDGVLFAGGAHIEIKYLGEVTILDRDAMRLIRTRDADPAAFLAIKFWVPTGVKIALNDQRDSTPYWLISCKKMEEVKRILCR